MNSRRNQKCFFPACPNPAERRRGAEKVCPACYQSKTAEDFQQELNVSSRKAVEAAKAVEEVVAATTTASTTKNKKNPNPNPNPAATTEKAFGEKQQGSIACYLSNEAPPGFHYELLSCSSSERNPKRILVRNRDDTDEDECDTQRKTMRYAEKVYSDKEKHEDDDQDEDEEEYENEDAKEVIEVFSDEETDKDDDQDEDEEEDEKEEAKEVVEVFSDEEKHEEEEEDEDEEEDLRLCLSDEGDDDCCDDHSVNPNSALVNPPANVEESEVEESPKQKKKKKKKRRLTNMDWRNHLDALCVSDSNDDETYVGELDKNSALGDDTPLHGEWVEEGNLRGAAIYLGRPT
jgi:hypothetical protein